MSVGSWLPDDTSPATLAKLSGFDLHERRGHIRVDHLRLIAAVDEREQQAVFDEGLESGIQRAEVLAAVLSVSLANLDLSVRYSPSGPDTSASITLTQHPLQQLSRFDLYLAPD